MTCFSQIIEYKWIFVTSGCLGKLRKIISYLMFTDFDDHLGVGSQLALH